MQIVFMSILFFGILVTSMRAKVVVEVPMQQECSQKVSISTESAHG